MAAPNEPIDPRFLPEEDGDSRNNLQNRLRELRNQYRNEVVTKRTADRMLRVAEGRKLRAQSYRSNASDQVIDQYKNQLAQSELNLERIETEILVILEELGDAPPAAALRAAAPKAKAPSRTPAKAKEQAPESVEDLSER